MAWLVKIIFCPLGDQSGSSSIAAGLFVMFFGRARFLRKSSMFMTKISLSVVAAPGKELIGFPVPDAEAWNTIFRLSGDQVAELPDRKSTRLNSSHTVISYAVFCLK